MSIDATYDVVIVGAGFAGLYALHRAREKGLRAVVLEAGQDVGGTWFWNRYPGARCDVESIDYSYSFSEDLQQEWNWTERYASQPEILRYIHHVADRFDLRRDVRLDTRLRAATWDDDAGRWSLTTDGGEELVATFCVLATGPLSAVKRPDFEGLDDFTGTWIHSARWPESGVDLAGKRVAVVGTGSTGTQIVPVVAREAAEVVVFQRTANFTVPARNRDLADGELDTVKLDYSDRRRRGRETASGVPADRVPPAGSGRSAEERRRDLDAGWAIGGGNGILRVYSDIMTDEEVNAAVAEYVRDQIRATVEDPDTAELLLPYAHPIGAKRLCVGTEYYETFNLPHVRLVDVSATPIERLVPEGLVVDGATHEVDVVIFAIGFDALTGAIGDIDIRGRDGRLLRDEWADGPQTYLGLAAPGFPNLFLVNGPGAPAVLGNVMAFLEHHVGWITDCIADLGERGVARIEASEEAETAWREQVATVAAATLYPRAKSWFVGANIPGKPVRFLPYAGGFHRYREICSEVVRNDYQGFELRSDAPAPA